MNQESFVAECASAAATGGLAAVVDTLQRSLALGVQVDADAEAPYVELHRGPDLLIQRFLWPPGYATRAHDHGGVWAAVGIVAGVEENQIYRRVGSSICPAKSTSYSAREVAALGREVVHAVRNPRSREWTVALHVYGGDLNSTPEQRWEWCPPDFNRQPFDPADNVSAFFEAVNDARGS